jgi:hypothetical protein
MVTAVLLRLGTKGSGASCGAVLQVVGGKTRVGWRTHSILPCHTRSYPARRRSLPLRWVLRIPPSSSQATSATAWGEGPASPRPSSAAAGGSRARTRAEPRPSCCTACWRLRRRWPMRACCRRAQTAVSRLRGSERLVSGGAVSGCRAVSGAVSGGTEGAAAAESGCVRWQVGTAETSDHQQRDTCEWVCGRRQQELSSAGALGVQ